MTANKPPVFHSAWSAYSDTARAIATMPSVTSMAIVIGVVYGLLDYAVGNLVGTDLDKSYEPVLASSVIGVVWNFFLTPFFIAIHRFIVLGETTTQYVLQPRDPRFLRFFGWSLFLSLLLLIPGLLVPLSGKDASGFMVAVITALMVGFLFVVVRSILLFPAIAVDAPGATWSNAFSDTRGYFWRITGILLVAMAPAIVIALVFSGTAEPSADDGSAEPSLLFSIGSSAISTILAALAVVIASRLYEAIGDRVKQP